MSSENFSDLEGLRQETLDLTGAGDGELVFFGQLIHTQNGNNILERFVILQDLLHATGNVVVVLSDDVGVQHTGGRIQRIDSRVDTQFGNTTGQHRGGVQMGESGSRGRISQIVSRYVDGLRKLIFHEITFTKHGFNCVTMGLFELVPTNWQ